MKLKTILTSKFISALLVVCAYAFRFYVGIDFVGKKGEKPGYTYPIMTESGVAYANLIGAVSSYLVVIAFLFLIWSWGREKPE